MPEGTLEEWVSTTLPTMIGGYEPKKIQNCDERALFFKLLFNRTYDVKGAKCAGGKKSNDRVTVLRCHNVDGSNKYVPLVIGKAEKPRCFKNIHASPVVYKNIKHTWMMSAIFIESLCLWIRKLQTKKCSVLLLLDQCPPHPFAIAPGFVNVKQMFPTFPPNSTRRLQPLDQGITWCVKTRYCQSVIRHILFQLEHANSSQLAAVRSLEALHYVKPLQKSRCAANRT